MRKAVTHLKKADPVLRAIIEKVGRCRMGFRTPEIHSLARSIVYQQLNGRAADVIFGRFALLAGDPLTPQGILKLSDEQLRGAGLSKQKSSYLKELAAQTASGGLDFSRLPDLPDAEVIEHLTKVKGIGVWTAQMFLMFSLRRADVLPTGDFAIRLAMYRAYLDKKSIRAAKKFLSGKSSGQKSGKNKSAAAKKAPKIKIKLPTPEQMEKIAKSWAPYRSVACWYLWQSLSVKTP
jgi:DNA-3-methyladenine glycosylase II